MAISNHFFKAAEQAKKEITKRKTPLPPQAENLPEFIPAKTSEGSAVVDQGINKPLVTIDLESATEKTPARIVLFFSVKPIASIRSQMKARNFWYHPENNGWSHIDTPETRQFINTLFDAKLDISEAQEYNDKPTSPINAPGGDLKPDPSLTPPLDFVVAPEPEVSPELARYRSQVDDLIEFLKCPPADLLLMAIDAYHKQIFSRPN